MQPIVSPPELRPAWDALKRIIEAKYPDLPALQNDENHAALDRYELLAWFRLTRDYELAHFRQYNTRFAEGWVQHYMGKPTQWCADLIAQLPQPKYPPYGIIRLGGPEPYVFDRKVWVPRPEREKNLANRRVASDGVTPVYDPKLAGQYPQTYADWLFHYEDPETLVQYYRAADIPPPWVAREHLFPSVLFKNHPPVVYKRKWNGHPVPRLRPLTWTPETNVESFVDYTDGSDTVFHLNAYDQYVNGSVTAYLGDQGYPSVADYMKNHFQTVRQGYNPLGLQPPPAQFRGPRPGPFAPQLPQPSWPKPPPKPFPMDDLGTNYRLNEKTGEWDLITPLTRDPRVLTIRNRTDKPITLNMPLDALAPPGSNVNLHSYDPPFPIPRCDLSPEYLAKLDAEQSKETPNMQPPNGVWGQPPAPVMGMQPQQPPMAAPMAQMQPPLNNPYAGVVPMNPMGLPVQPLPQQPMQQQVQQQPMQQQQPQMQQPPQQYAQQPPSQQQTFATLPSSNANLRAAMGLAPLPADDEDDHVVVKPKPLSHPTASPMAVKVPINMPVLTDAQLSEGWTYCVDAISGQMGVKPPPVPGGKPPEANPDLVAAVERGLANIESLLPPKTKGEYLAEAAARAYSMFDYVTDAVVPKAMSLEEFNMYLNSIGQPPVGASPVSTQLYGNQLAMHQLAMRNQQGCKLPQLVNVPGQGVVEMQPGMVVVDPKLQAQQAEAQIQRQGGAPLQGNMPYGAMVMQPNVVQLPNGLLELQMVPQPLINPDGTLTPQAAQVVHLPVDPNQRPVMQPMQPQMQQPMQQPFPQQQQMQPQMQQPFQPAPMQMPQQPQMQQPAPYQQAAQPQVQMPHPYPQLQQPQPFQPAPVMAPTPNGNPFQVQQPAPVMQPVPNGNPFQPQQSLSYATQQATAQTLGAQQPMFNPMLQQPLPFVPNGNPYQPQAALNANVVPTMNTLGQPVPPQNPFGNPFGNPYQPQMQLPFPQQQAAFPQPPMTMASMPVLENAAVQAARHRPLYDAWQWDEQGNPLKGYTDGLPMYVTDHDREEHFKRHGTHMAPPDPGAARRERAAAAAAGHPDRPIKDWVDPGPDVNDVPPPAQPAPQQPTYEQPQYAQPQAQPVQPQQVQQPQYVQQPPTQQPQAYEQPPVQQPQPQPVAQPQYVHTPMSQPFPQPQSSSQYPRPPSPMETDPNVPQPIRQQLAYERNYPAQSREQPVVRREPKPFVQKTVHDYTPEDFPAPDTTSYAARKGPKPFTVGPNETVVSQPVEQDWERLTYPTRSEDIDIIAEDDVDLFIDSRTQRPVPEHHMPFPPPPENTPQLDHLRRQAMAEMGERDAFLIEQENMQSRIQPIPYDEPLNANNPAYQAVFGNAGTNVSPNGSVLPSFIQTPPEFMPGARPQRPDRIPETIPADAPIMKGLKPMVFSDEAPATPTTPVEPVSQPAQPPVQPAVPSQPPIFPPPLNGENEEDDLDVLIDETTGETSRTACIGPMVQYYTGNDEDRPWPAFKGTTKRIQQFVARYGAEGGMNHPIYPNTDSQFRPPNLVGFVDHDVFPFVKTEWTKDNVASFENTVQKLDRDGDHFWYAPVAGNNMRMWQADMATLLMNPTPEVAFDGRPIVYQDAYTDYMFALQTAFTTLSTRGTPEQQDIMRYGMVFPLPPKPTPMGLFAGEAKFGEVTLFDKAYYNGTVPSLSSSVADITMGKPRIGSPEVDIVEAVRVAMGIRQAGNWMGSQQLYLPEQHAGKVTLNRGYGHVRGYNVYTQKAFHIVDDFGTLSTHLYDRLHEEDAMNLENHIADLVTITDPKAASLMRSLMFDRRQDIHEDRLAVNNAYGLSRIPVVEKASIDDPRRRSIIDYREAHAHYVLNRHDLDTVLRRERLTAPEYVQLKDELAVLQAQQEEIGSMDCSVEERRSRLNDLLEKCTAVQTKITDYLACEVNNVHGLVDQHHAVYMRPIYQGEDAVTQLRNMQTAIERCYIPNHKELVAALPNLMKPLSMENQRFMRQRITAHFNHFVRVLLLQDWHIDDYIDDYQDAYDELVTNLGQHHADKMLNDMFKSFRRMAFSLPVVATTLPKDALPPRLYKEDVLVWLTGESSYTVDLTEQDLEGYIDVLDQSTTCLSTGDRGFADLLKDLADIAAQMSPDNAGTLRIQTAKGERFVSITHAPTEGIMVVISRRHCVAEWLDTVA